MLILEWKFPFFKVYKSCDPAIYFCGWYEITRPASCLQAWFNMSEISMKTPNV